MGNVLRKGLEPPAVQQAAFDDTVSILNKSLPVIIYIYMHAVTFFCF